jgi:hypothetical protein
MAPIGISSSRRRVKSQLRRPNGSRLSCVPQVDRAAGTAWFRRQRVTQVGRNGLWHVSFNRLLGSAPRSADSRGRKQT